MREARCSTVAMFAAAGGAGGCAPPVGRGAAGLGCLAGPGPAPTPSEITRREKKTWTGREHGRRTPDIVRHGCMSELRPTATPASISGTESMGRERGGRGEGHGPLTSSYCAMEGEIDEGEVGSCKEQRELRGSVQGRREREAGRRKLLGRAVGEGNVWACDLFTVHDLNHGMRLYFR
jgi:hypothetical protein